MPKFIPTSPSRRTYIVQDKKKKKKFSPIMGGGITQLKPLRSTVLRTMVNNFIESTIDVGNVLLEEDSEEWESSYIYGKIDECCNNPFTDWELFTGSLAKRLKTGYNVGEEYRFILSVLANAAYLRRKPMCSRCRRKIVPKENTVLFVCPFCRLPIHE